MKAHLLRAEFQGPLPPPQVLAQYNEVVPGLAERVVQMAESQSRHRQELERQVVAANVAAEKRASWFGFILLTLLSLGGFVLISRGYGPHGIAIVIGALASFAGAYVWGKKQQQKELAWKRRMPAAPENP